MRYRVKMKMYMKPDQVNRARKLSIVFLNRLVKGDSRILSNMELSKTEMVPKYGLVLPNNIEIITKYGDMIEKAVRAFATKLKSRGIICMFESSCMEIINEEKQEQVSLIDYTRKYHWR